ncbi:MAG: DNA-binding response regulator [Flammeovirgaceae bacterium]|nr:DNA-binding response regulator [Flammeovirgaceae bacterium]MBE63736.1 DNA-binding response regulator [Flammeovirgaceae bacterium]MBR06938.1 DNA-binding response regulator [Rickettsiales bacterium]HCX23783.1 DNA-binding response regulator [Cytophagales bacterium]|tara:strand:- start:6590 stop:7306 length:717 start_codon:yes stop_codon:yes gene_type:complete
MQIKCLIIDDEPLAIKVIEKYIDEVDELECVGKCENAMDALKMLQEKQVDLIFLDINMPKLTGMELLQTLKDPPLVVITTAYREYAVESYDYDVVDYLVKPIEFPRFFRMVQKVMDRLKIPTAPTPQPTATGDAKLDHLFLKVDKKMVKVFLKDILYVESLKDYVMVHTINEDLIVHHNLQSFTELLPASSFTRIHRSYTVSLEKIKAIDGNQVEIGGKYLPIGRNYQSEVKSKILNS